MSLYVVVNARADLPGATTTRTLVERLGDEATLVEVDDIGLHEDGRVLVGEGTLEAGDRVLIRTNPARAEVGQDHGLALELLALAQEQGVTVMNDPRALARASTKLYLSTLPAHLRPRTLVSRNRTLLRRFVKEAPGRTVVKPVSGTRGSDVFLLRPDAENLPQILDVVCRRGLAVAQDFVPEAVDGDTRVVVLGGRVLERGGRVCAVRRVPPAHDFRSNVAIGGSPTPADLSDAVRAVAEEAAAHLLADGIHLAGLDIIGTRIVEANVFATGGLPDAILHTGEDFFASVIDYFRAL